MRAAFTPSLDGSTVRSVLTLYSVGDSPSVSTVITGPKVLVFEAGQDFKNYQLDGLPLNNPALVSYFDGNDRLLVSVESGDHILTSATSNLGAGDLPAFEEIAGYALLVRGAGTEVSVTPVGLAYAKGATVETKAIASETTEYIGLSGQGAILGDTLELTVKKSANFVAAKWIETEIMGFPAQYAGAQAWKANNYGTYSSGPLRNRNWSFLKFTDLPAGLLSYGFRMDQNYGYNEVRTRLWIDGAEIAISWSDCDGYDYWPSGVLPVTGASTEIVFGFQEMGLGALEHPRPWCFKSLATRQALPRPI